MDASGLGMCYLHTSGSLLICKDLSGKEVTGTLDSMEGDWNTYFLVFALWFWLTILCWRGEQPPSLAREQSSELVFY